MLVMSPLKPRQIIKFELSKKGISQAQAANELGIDLIQFDFIACGWIIPPPEIRLKVADYLGLAQNVLFNVPS